MLYKAFRACSFERTINGLMNKKERKRKYNFFKKFVARVVTNCEVHKFLFCVLVGVTPCSSCLCLHSLHFGPA